MGEKFAHQARKYLTRANHVLWLPSAASKTSPEYLIEIGLLINAFFVLKRVDWKKLNRSSKNNKFWAEIFMQVHYATEVNGLHGYHWVSSVAKCNCDAT